MAGIFGALSLLRGARIFHPDGVAYSGTLRVERAEPSLKGAALFEGPGEFAATFRFSRGVGLPESLPDVLGLAVRVNDAYGTGRHQDFLLVSSGAPPGLRHLLLPAHGGFVGQFYSSVLLYRLAGELRLVGAQPLSPEAGSATGALAELVGAADAGNLRYRLAAASLAGPWQPLADLHVAARLSEAESERLAFTPWNTGGGIRPTGPFMGIRQAAYRASQSARGLSPNEIP